MKLIYLKKGNNSTGTASIFPMLTATETEELVAIAFSNPNKIWNIDGNSQKWESLVNKLHPKFKATVSKK
ncbi:hypothetical protein [Flavobacterium sp.]|uniref:hypothetical protein n=1 Tax=Flavobacterium sp. TaxID=239 RepID=UPI003D0C31A0